MSELRFPIEELDSGLRAVFINLPHFRTSAARLVIQAGSLHEEDDTAGAAHFLEHLTFQGTGQLRDAERVAAFGENREMYHNAHTSLTSTVYKADGPDLDNAAYFLSQVVFAPRLSAAALERERLPIYNEVRDRASDPRYLAQHQHSGVMWGDWCGKPIEGTVEDVRALTHEHLTDYYRRHYRLANAVLVICSGLPVDQQRRVVEDNMEAALLGALSGDSVPPVDIGVESFNPSHTLVSLQQVPLPEQAQTAVNIHYELPRDMDRVKQLQHSILAWTLAFSAHRRLRQELGIAYGADSNIYWLSNLNYGADTNWSALSVGSSLHAANCIGGLDALLNDVLRAPAAEKDVERAQKLACSGIDYVLQDNPGNIASNVASSVTNRQIDGIDLEDKLKIVPRITLEDIRKLQSEVLERSPLLTVTSPSAQVLSEVEDWAHTVDFPAST